MTRQPKTEAGQYVASKSSHKCNTRLYIVRYSVPYESGSILGIFDSLDLAQAVIDDDDNLCRKSYLDIVEVTLNEVSEIDI